jgi:hypothetical protein
VADMEMNGLETCGILSWYFETLTCSGEVMCMVNSVSIMLWVNNALCFGLADTQGLQANAYFAGLR